jgi:hypothetical protein
MSEEVKEQDPQEPAESTPPEGEKPEQISGAAATTAAEAGDAPVDDKPDPAAMKAEKEALAEERKRIAAENRAAYWQRKAVEQPQRPHTPAQPDQQPPAEMPEGNAKPDPSQFDDYDQYIDALTTWKVDAKRAEWEADQQRRQQNAAYQEREARFREKLDEGFANYQDFGDVVFDPTLPISQTMKEIVMESDKPAEVLYHLAKNRVDAVRISRMTPAAAAREIVKIENQLGVTKPGAQQKKSTGAPPPISPVGPSGSHEKDPEKMTQAEFAAWRAKHGARPY